MQAIKATGTIDERGQLNLDYPLNLSHNSRVEVIILVQDSDIYNSNFVAEDDTPKEEVLADLRQAWHEAMTDQTIPISQLWENIENG